MNDIRENNDERGVEQVERLLDRALDAGQVVDGGVPEGLVERVMAATAGELGRADLGDGVAGRIGWGWGVRVGLGLAAVFCLLATVWVSMGLLETGDGGGDRGGLVIAVAGGEDVGQVGWSDDVVDEVDQELSALEAELALGAMGDQWGEEADTFDDVFDEIDMDEDDYQMGLF